MDVNDKNDEFECLMNHIIKINNHIQAIVWERGLLSNIKKYEALRSNLQSPNEEGILILMMDKRLMGNLFKILS